MKLMKYSWLAALLMIFTACQEDALVENQHQDKWISSLTAQVGQSVQSRAQILLNNPVSGDELFYWNEGDCFSIYQARENYFQRSEFQISSNYTEPENGSAAISAEFSTETPVSSSENFVAIYPNGNWWNQEYNNINRRLQDWLDFSENSQEKVWKDYFKQNMFMIAEGNFDQMETPAVNFRHLCALARITYVNNTGLDQKIEAFRLSGGQGFDMEYVYDLSEGTGESYNTSSMSQIWTHNLIVAAGETTDLYMLFFPKSFGEGVMDITLKFENEEYKSVQIPFSKIAEKNPGADVFEAGKRYWFKLTDGASQGLVWSYEYNKVEAPEGTIVFENPGFSKALYKCWGDNNQVGLDYRGYAFMWPKDVTEIRELDFGWQNHYVTSWSGIEHFENLEIFTCANSNVESADFSKNTKLKRVTISNSPITSLDFSNCPDLEQLDCSYQPKLTFLNLSGCTQLYHLQLERTGLTSLGVPDPSKIRGFHLPAGLTIDFAEYSNLNQLGLQERGLTDLTMIPTDVKKRLYYLNVQSNQLTTIDLSEFPQLTGLDCSYNQLTALDVSVRPKLTQLQSYCNNMETLDISTLKRLEYLDCGNQNNEQTLVLSLTEDQKMNWWDSNWKYNTWSNANVTLNVVDGPIDPDITFTNTELANVLYNVLGSNMVTLNANGTAVMKQSDVEDVTYLNLGRGEYTLTTLDGIENFKSLETLICNNTGLKACDLSGNIALKKVSLQQNDIVNLDLNKNVNLEELHLHGNFQLASLTINQCSNLRILNLNDVGEIIRNVEIADVTKIEILGYGYTQLSFNLNEFTNLKELSCYGHNFDELNLSDERKVNLEKLECYYCEIDALDLSEYPNLTFLSCYRNNINYLDLTKVPSLETLNCHGNQLESLDITPLANTLNYLYCGNQNIGEGNYMILTLTESQKDKWNEQGTGWYDNSWGLNENVKLSVSGSSTPSNGNTGGNDFPIGGNF